jgi:hypothetical protein
MQKSVIIAVKLVEDSEEKEITRLLHQTAMPNQ